jgi:hypothetical protein
MSILSKLDKYVWVRRGFLCCGLAVLLLAVGLALPARAAEAPTLTVGITQYPSTFNPLI